MNYDLCPAAVFTFSTNNEINLRGTWALVATVSLQYGVLQIFIILKPPNMSNYSAFKPTGGTTTSSPAPAPDTITTPAPAEQHWLENTNGLTQL